MDILLKLKYTMEDARRRRSPRTYAQAVVRNARSAGFATESQQVGLIYSNIDYELRRDLRRPEENTTLDSFLLDVDECAEGWYDVDVCLKHLLGEGKSLDDPQLLLLCTQEDVRKFIMLIQDKLPRSKK
jgi:hypothetical protein